MSKKPAKKSAPKAAAKTEEGASKKRRSSRSKETFANAKVEKLIREAGAFRVSSGAVKALNDLLGAKGDSIARYAVEIARNSGRKTVKDTDVILASQR
jgi:histone H3/H4